MLAARTANVWLLGSSDLVPVFTSANGAAHLTQDEEDDPDYQDDNADRPQNADAQDPAQDQQDETKNNHVILLEC
jgi:hypothetical protein